MIHCSSNKSLPCLFSDNYKNGDIATSEDYLELRKNQEVWEKFMMSYVAIVYGTSGFLRNSKVQLVSGFVNVSDEAFALLTLECYYDRWKKMADMNLEASDSTSTLPGGRYITRKSNGKGYGWSPDGYRRYAEIHQLVSEDRKGDHALEAEENLRAKCANTKEKKQTGLQQAYNDIEVPYDF